MSKNRHHEESSLEEALSPIVNRLIDKNYETSQDKISMQMAPLIGKAIREQIKSQKDDVVDALYPVLGSMIRRYVTKTLEDMLSKINSQLQDGFSSKSIKRKIKAKLQGVSESELLLNENATANIRALLLIHKETGVVLVHSENPNYPLSEPEMLASMMSAIRSFVNDWIVQNSDSNELGEIEYGGNKIIIEASGYSYLAVIVEGSVNRANYDKIRETLENIVLHHGDAIREFNGNLDKFPKIDIYQKISMLLNDKEQKKEKKKIHPLIFFIPLLFLFWAGYSYYKSYQNQELEQTISKQFDNTSQLTSLKINTSVNDGVVTLSGNVPFSYHKHLAQTLVQKMKNVFAVKNELVVIDSLEDPMQISSNIAYLLRGLNSQDGINLTYSYKYALLSIKGSVWNDEDKEKVMKEIQKIPNIQKVEYKIAIIPPKLDVKIYFNKTKTTLTPQAQAKLIKAINTIKILDKDYVITLTSYSDQIGSYVDNMRLSKKRLSNTISFLQNQGDVTKTIKQLMMNMPPKDIDPKKEPQNARCIYMSYEKKGE